MQDILVCHGSKVKYFGLWLWSCGSCQTHGKQLKQLRASKCTHSFRASKYNNLCAATFIERKKGSIDKSLFFSELALRVNLAWPYMIVIKGQDWEKYLWKKNPFWSAFHSKHIKRNYWGNCGMDKVENSFYLAL